MLKNLIERQVAIKTRVDEYAPIREVFEEFLKTGRREDEGLFWWMSPGDRHSRYSWRRRETVATPAGRKVVIEAFTDPAKHWLGHEAGDVRRALINVKVSLPENSTVSQELELLPIWAILKENPGFLVTDVSKLGEDLEDIVPLVRACLPEFNPLTNESNEFS